MVPGSPSTGVAIAMDGGMTDTACSYTDRYNVIGGGSEGGSYPSLYSNLVVSIGRLLLFNTTRTLSGPPSTGEGGTKYLPVKRHGGSRYCNGKK